MKNPDHIRAAAEEYADKCARWEAEGLVSHKPRALLIAEWTRDHKGWDDEPDMEAAWTHRHGRPPNWKRDA